MGERVGGQDRLFYEFCLDEVVPDDHLLRRIDSVLDLIWLRRELSPYYSHTGCPSVDPELLIRMMLIGYCYSIRSDRRLDERRPVRPELPWSCFQRRSNSITFLIALPSRVPTAYGNSCDEAAAPTRPCLSKAMKQADSSYPLGSRADMRWITSSHASCGCIPWRIISTIITLAQ